jgi:hypothetical protein
MGSTSEAKKLHFWLDQFSGDAPWFCLSRGDYGLAQPVRTVLRTFDDSGQEVLPGCRPSGAFDLKAGDL